MAALSAAVADGYIAQADISANVRIGAM